MVLVTTAFFYLIDWHITKNLQLKLISKLKNDWLRHRTQNLKMKAALLLTLRSFLFTVNEYSNSPLMLILTFQNIIGLLPCHSQVSFVDFSPRIIDIFILRGNQEIILFTSLLLDRWGLNSYLILDRNHYRSPKKWMTWPKFTVNSWIVDFPFSKCSTLVSILCC